MGNTQSNGSEHFRGVFIDENKWLEPNAVRFVGDRCRMLVIKPSVLTLTALESGLKQARKKFQAAGASKEFSMPGRIEMGSQAYAAYSRIQ